MAIIYGLKVNLSVTIVAMIDHDEVAKVTAIVRRPLGIQHPKLKDAQVHKSETN